MAPSSRNAIMDRARKQVEAQMKQAEDERRKQMIKKRLEYINNGIRAAKLKKHAEAVVNYQAYIKLLEDWKGVPVGALSPNNFDYTKEMGDMLMLAGLYWDLAKLFDHSDSAERKKLFKHYLEKFILFSKGTTWQPMCAEQLRRYLRTTKPKHRAEMKNAHRLLGGRDQCFVVTALSEYTDFETIPRLREFRDRSLVTNAPGRAFVKTYYAVGPHLATAVVYLPTPIRKMMARFFDGLSKKVSATFW